MRVRVYSWNYHTDPMRLADEVNECIKSCENVGDTVLDADVIVRPNDRAEQGLEYLIIIKYEGNRHAYLLPHDLPAGEGEVNPAGADSPSPG